MTEIVPKAPEPVKSSPEVKPTTGNIPGRLSERARDIVNRLKGILSFRGGEKQVLDTLAGGIENPSKDREPIQIKVQSPQQFGPDRTAMAAESAESAQRATKVELAPVAKEAETPEELSEKLKDPKYLPTHHEVEKAFQGRWQEFPAFCSERRVYEFLNREFIDSLSDYIRDRIGEIGRGKQGKVRIVEVAAGDGRLTYFLSQKMEELGLADKVEIIATDDNSGEKEYGGFNKDLPVEELNAKEAVEKYYPGMVVCSWMPYEVDLSSAFRQDGVQEYILIGGGPDGVCGSDATWEEHSGFEMINSDDVDKNIHKYQIGRNDHEIGFGHTQVYLFRRETDE